MQLEQIAGQLSGIERKTLLGLSGLDWKTVEELAQSTGLPLDSVRRSLEWLKEKQLLDISDETQSRFELSSAGKQAWKNGLAEIRLLVWLGEHSPSTIEEAKQK